MKYAILLLATVGLFSAKAQLLTDNAIGLRFGGDFGIGAEISYQRLLNDENRLELDLGIKNDNAGDVFQISGTYQKVFFLDKSFHYYGGLGGGFGRFSADNDVPFIDDEGYLILMGVVGIEHSFNNNDLPIQISLDLRPNLVFGDINDGFNLDIGLGFRYQFN